MPPDERFDHLDEFVRGGPGSAVAAWQFRALRQWKVTGQNVVDTTMERNGIRTGDDQDRTTKLPEPLNVVRMRGDHG